MTEQSFMELLEFHADLDEVFALHQEALLERRLELARELLGIHSSLLALHMKQEEEVLLPIFERAGTVERWPKILYTGQHEKLVALLGRAGAALDAMIATPLANPRRAVIALLDHETTYKHLHEHHDGAERQGLFPTCDAVTTSAERAGLLSQLRRDWRAACSRYTAALDAARQSLSPSLDA